MINIIGNGGFHLSTSRIIWPIRRAITQSGYQRQHKIATDFYNYVDKTGKIEVWEEMWSPSVRVIWKKRFKGSKRTIGVLMSYPHWKPIPFCSENANKTLDIKGLTIMEFLAIVKIMKVCQKLTKELKKQTKTFEF